MSTPKTLTLRPDWFSTPAIQSIIAIMDVHAPADSYRFVGGCVRDSIMGRQCGDIDIATTLEPTLISDIFRLEGFDVIPTGIEHGTVSVIINKTAYEFTTLRRDVETDGRRAVIAFTKDWAEDAQRRDFRFNALYLGPDGTVYDPTRGGIEDAKARRIQFVGDAEQRLREDHLRSLRLFRFMAVLGADISAEALAACKAQRDGIASLSGERIEKEISKLLGAGNPVPALEAMQRTEVYSTIFPVAFDARVFTRVCQATTDWAPRFASLFNWDMQACGDVMARLRFSNASRQRVTNAIKQGPFTEMGGDAWFDSIEQHIYRDGVVAVRDRMALTWACGLPFDFDTLADQINKVGRLAPRVFPISGAMLIDRGMKPGKAMGDILRATEEEWVKVWFDMNRTNDFLNGLLAKQGL
jgi:poly(A) polymerase